MSGFQMTQNVNQEYARSVKVHTGISHDASQQRSKKSELERCLSVLAGNRHRPKGEDQVENEHEQNEKPEKVQQHPLNERIEAIEAGLNEYKKKMDSLENILLETRRFVARKSIEDLRFFLDDWIAKNVLNTNPQLYYQMHDFLTSESSAAQQALKTSTAPISVAEQFGTNCEKCFKSHNLRAFLWD